MLVKMKVMRKLKAQKLNKNNNNILHHLCTEKHNYYCEAIGQCHSFSCVDALTRESLFCCAVEGVLLIESSVMSCSRVSIFSYM